MATSPLFLYGSKEYGWTARLRTKYPRTQAGRAVRRGDCFRSRPWQFVRLCVALLLNLLEQVHWPRKLKFGFGSVLQNWYGISSRAADRAEGPWGKDIARNYSTVLGMILPLRDREIFTLKIKIFALISYPFFYIHTHSIILYVSYPFFYIHAHSIVLYGYILVLERLAILCNPCSLHRLL